MVLVLVHVVMPVSRLSTAMTTLSTTTNSTSSSLASTTTTRSLTCTNRPSTTSAIRTAVMIHIWSSASTATKESSGGEIKWDRQLWTAAVVWTKEG